jgi:LmbE family N-acetylglucosaminyl deacetylase
MLFFAAFLLVFCSAVVLLWLFGVLLLLDISVPTQSVDKYKRILVIFPHADDEVFHAGGLIGEAHDRGSKVVYAILTKGERGTPDAHRDDTLKPIRTAEAECAAKALHVTTLLQEDFGDLMLASKKKAIRQYLHKLITAHQPSLIVTYDRAGLYGHPDHIICSELISVLVHDEFPDIRLWYPCFPKRLYRFINLPEHMAEDPSFKGRRAVPSLKIFVWPRMIAKNHAAKCYKSQSSSRIIPVPLLPMSFFYSMITHEYFEEVN